MALSKDLIALAHQIVRLNKGKPQQAQLRRALSTAYYAVFHFLIEKATHHVVGGAHKRTSLRAFLSRGVPHERLKKFCKEISQKRWPSIVKERVGPGVMPGGPSQALMQIADSFVSLQEHRIDADYSVTKRFSRTAVIIELGKADALMNNWGKLPNTYEKDFFLYLIATNNI